MNCSFEIYNFLEEISNLSLSIVFRYFFALITEDGFLISLLGWMFFVLCKVLPDFATLSLLLFMFWLFGLQACGILVPPTGIKPTPSVL